MKKGELVQIKESPLSFVEEQLIKFRVEDIEVTITPQARCEAYENEIKRLAKYILHLKEMSER